MQEIKGKILGYLEENKEKFIEISHQIHMNPEIGNQEFFASELLCEKLTAEGFEVKKDIAGYATGFVAKKSLGQAGGPNIAFMCEYDALAGLGHACGHNLIAAISMGAAIALTKSIAPCPGTVFVFGCPAEEGGVNNASAKAAFVNAGLFTNIDAAMQIHANGSHSITTPHLAVDSWNIEFFGKPAHAAAFPEKGINALDAMILFFSAIGLLRQQLKDEARLHGVIVHGGEAPNIIPRYTLAKFYVRAETKEYCAEICEKVESIAKGAALSTGCTYEMARYKNTVDNFLLCPEFDALYQEIGESLGMVFESHLDGKGSSDVGNVSQVVPTIQPYIKICPPSISAHTADFREAAISEEADASIILGAKALSLLALRLFSEPELLSSIKSAHHSAKQAKVEA